MKWSPFVKQIRMIVSTSIKIQKLATVITEFWGVAEKVYADDTDGNGLNKFNVIDISFKSSL